jgi:opacity protein-like surface antigen
LRKFIYLLSIFLYSSAWAAPGINVKGFGSAGVVRADHPTYYLGEFGTFGKRPTFAPDTRLGVNLSSDLTGGWTFASQFISENGRDGYTPKLDWAFVSYQPIPEFSIRVGRLVLPTWLFSQQLKVGYSYLWVRPPVEVYSLIGGLSSVNGISLLSSLPVLGGELSMEVYGGYDDAKGYSNNPAALTTSDSRLTDLVGVDLTYSYTDIWSVHASYLQSHTNTKVTTISSAFTTSLDLNFGQFFSFGGKVDHKNFIVIGEFARRLLSGRALQRVSSWYGTLGYRISKVTPYVTYGWMGGLAGTHYTHPNSPTVTTLKKEQYSYILGVNTQVHDSVIIKGEWQPAFYRYADSTKDFRVDVISASANFIF